MLPLQHLSPAARVLVERSMQAFWPSHMQAPRSSIQSVRDLERELARLQAAAAAAAAAAAESHPSASYPHDTLVFAQYGLNPQIRFALGQVEGAATGANGIVQLRLLYVLRNWGMDSCRRQDASWVQQHYSGLGLYAEFFCEHTVRIDANQYSRLLQFAA